MAASDTHNIHGMDDVFLQTIFSLGRHSQANVMPPAPGWASLVYPTASDLQRSSAEVTVVVLYLLTCQRSQTWFCFV